MINQLARQFDVDPLLQYSVIWIHLQRDQIGKLPALYEKNRGLLGSSLNAEGLAQGFHCIAKNISENNTVPDDSTQKVSQLTSTFIFSVFLKIVPMSYNPSPSYQTSGYIYIHKCGNVRSRPTCIDRFTKVTLPLNSVAINRRRTLRNGDSQIYYSSHRLIPYERPKQLSIYT